MARWSAPSSSASEESVAQAFKVFSSNVVETEFSQLLGDVSHHLEVGELKLLQHTGTSWCEMRGE